MTWRAILKSLRKGKDYGRDINISRPAEFVSDEGIVEITSYDGKPGFVIVIHNETDAARLITCLQHAFPSLGNPNKKIAAKKAS